MGCFMYSNRSQSMQIELAVGVVLFIIAVGLFFVLLPSSAPSQSQAFHLSESLLSYGIPIDWNASTVQKIGLFSVNSQLDPLKVAYVYSLSPTQLSQALFTDAYVHIVIYNSSGPLIFSGKSYAGFAQPNSSSSSYVHTLERITLYNQSIVLLRVQVWQKR
jgi:hypothetical protein